jgi:hypothetical protein
MYRGVLIGTHHLEEVTRPSHRRRCRTSYVVGAGAGVDAPAPVEVLGGESLPLVTRWGPRYLVNTTPAMGGELLVGGRLIGLAEYVRERGRSFTLPASGIARIECGAMTFQLERTPRPERVPRRWFALDREQHKYTLGSVVGLGLLLLMAIFVPPDAGSLSGGESLLTQRAWLPTTVTAPGPEDVPLFLARPARGDEGKAHQGDSGKMGDHKSRDRGKRYAMKGNARPEERSLDKDRAVAAAQNAGVVGLLNRVQGSALHSIFSRSSAVGSDAENALGNLIGTEIGSAYGIGGVGMVGSGPGGGGTGMNTLGIGRFNTIGKGGLGDGGDGPNYGRNVGQLDKGRRVRVLDVIPGVANVRGGLDKEIIRRVVRRHMNEVKFCYEQELTRSPDLAGRISLSFMIAGSGHVIASLKQSSTMGNPRVESCVLNAVKRWEFPRPAGGGMVQVVYPFNFVPAGS